MTRSIEHPRLKKGAVEKRQYQLELAISALGGSTLVVLPTGLGKTVVALLVLLVRLEKGRILMLAPTKPLVEQHASFLKDVLADGSQVVQFTGETPPEKRSHLWEGAKIVVSTPQVIENDLLSKRIGLADVSCVIFDEAHRASGSYAYVYIAARYLREARDPLILGITASPGSESERIDDVCKNLGITNILIKTDDDPDVAPFIHNKRIEWVNVSVPDKILAIRGVIEGALDDRMNELVRLLSDPSFRHIGISSKTSKKELLELQKMLKVQVAKKPNRALFQAVSVLAEIFKLKHAVELAETQGTSALARYFERLDNEARSKTGSKASRRIMEDPGIQKAISMVTSLDIEHPKLQVAREIVLKELGSNEDSKIIIFTNYRDTARALVEFLEKEESIIKPARFVGQSSRYEDEGLSQKEQAEILRRFREGDFNVLVATSVGEEGIDIPATDMVLFYEPVPSEIRSIQRKGRTGRTRAGRVVVLIAKGTRDEAYYWISNRKEKEMERQIRSLGAASDKDAAFDHDWSDEPTIQNEIDGEIVKRESARIEVYVDPRERSIAKKIEALGIDVRLKVLEVGDYVLSDRVAIERKTAEDFVNSIIHPERELFRQISDLSRSYERPLLLLEGSEFHNRQVHPNAIRGAMAAIAVDFGVPIIPTGSEEESALFIALTARREQLDEGRGLKAHGSKTSRTLKEQQEYLISAIPSVGPAVARNLLRHFGSVERIVNASFEELLDVELVGPKIAERIRELVAGEYKG